MVRISSGVRVCRGKMWCVVLALHEYESMPTFKNAANISVCYQVLGAFHLLGSANAVSCHQNAGRVYRVVHDEPTQTPVKPELPVATPKPFLVEEAISV